MNEKHKSVVCDLVSESAEDGSTIQLKVFSNSMKPCISVNDTIISKKIPPDNLKFGDIITFKKHGDIFTHRLLFKEKKDKKLVLTTKGDNSFFIDEPVKVQDYLGKVIGVNKIKTAHDLESKRWRAINIFMGCTSFIINFIYKFLRKVKRLTTSK